MYKVFIDGQEGTTGLRIYERLEKRSDIEILRISETRRKSPTERKKFINASDITFLCLPDESAIEAVSLCDNPNTKIIDASTAHRTDPNWAYGLPELSLKHRQNIIRSKRVAVPGCYATGFVSLVYPMITANVLESHYPVFAYGISGYSGGGKNRIKQYESPHKPYDFYSPMLYSLNLEHKHIPEMKLMSGLAYNPMFSPVIDDYYNGMLVCIPLHSRLLRRKTSVEDIKNVYRKHYANQKFISVLDNVSDDKQFPHFAANLLADTNYLEIAVFGNSEQFMLVSRLDNLGKGASGAAVQCMNIMLGIEETYSLL
ncbi:MAG: N-acetyl-gamma-glutamyl-phosphate reductase [Oscillospiraceae bacterium]|jgi:N-acetyl-gamma-glutamyl-phosphate reductase|nr:N-acetyl-gamma-glutamyl-phosphate reductase [Oscillospiraceae bacterium]